MQTPDAIDNSMYSASVCLTYLQLACLLPTSTQHHPVIHVIIHTKLSPFFATFPHLHALLSTQTEEQKMGQALE